MNKNTSPQTRSASRSRAQVRGRGGTASSKSAARVASKVGSQARARRATAPTTMAGRIRRMLWTVAIPNVVVVLIVLSVTLAALLLTSSPLAWLPTIVAESLMVFNLAPVSAGGIELSVMPLLPAGLLAFVVGHRVRQAIKHKVSINDLLVLLACVVAVPLVLTIIAWLMLWDAGKVYDVSPPNFFAVLPRMLLLHLVALAGGMGPRLWKALAKRFGFPRMLVDAAVTALRYLGALSVVAALVFVIVGIVGWSRQGQLMDSYPAIDGVGTFLLYCLSLLYLPNAIVGTSGVLAGSEFQFGPESSVSLFSIHMVPLPPLPIVGVVPGAVSSWAIGLLALPICAAIVVVWRARRHVSFAFAAAATVFVALFTLIASCFVTGTLGTYGATGLNIWSTTGLVALWFAAIAFAFACAFAIGAWHASRSASASAAAAADEAEEAAGEAALTDGDTTGVDAGADAGAEAAASAAPDDVVNADVVDAEIEESDASDTGDAGKAEGADDAEETEDIKESTVGEAGAPSSETEEAAGEPVEEAAEEPADEQPNQAQGDVDVSKEGAEAVEEDLEVVEGEIVEEFPQKGSKD
ncbi:TPA: hypothetical protein I8X58_001598 [Corynebacterium striatum]|nr:hypothetical protein [Corynebacterium striatum]